MASFRPPRENLVCLDCYSELALDGSGKVLCLSTGGTCAVCSEYTVRLWYLPHGEWRKSSAWWVQGSS